MSTFTRNTPLARVRDDVDDQSFVDNKEVAGGRPVSLSTFLFSFADLVLLVLRHL